MRLLRRASVWIDLSNPNDVETPDVNQMAMDQLNKYVGTCFDHSYVIKIDRIEMVGDREVDFRKMYGEASMNVIFWYEAEIFEEDSGVILHEAIVTKITNDTIMTCTSGDHITATVIVDIPGVVNVGMTIPVRVVNVTYPQDISNKISIEGELLKPFYYDPVILSVSVPTEDEIKQVQVMLKEVNALIDIVNQSDRAQFFKSWLYPHKNLPKDKPLTLSVFIKKEQTRPTFVQIDDTCDTSNMEFKRIKKQKAVNAISFLDFGTMLTTDATRFWNDVLHLSQTYESKDMFMKHSTIWKYYEGAKDVSRSDDEYDNKSDDEPVITPEQNQLSNEVLMSNDAKPVAKSKSAKPEKKKAVPKK